MSETEVPQLNELVYSVILKWVVRKEQERLLETEMMFNKCDDVNLTVEWPTQLRSYSERVVHHASVKLLPNSRLNFNWWKFWFRYKGEKPRYELLQEDWRTMKHFGITFIPWLRPPEDLHPPLIFYGAERNYPCAMRIFYSPVELLYDYLLIMRKRTEYQIRHEESCQCQWCILEEKGEDRLWESELNILQETVPIRGLTAN